MRKLILLFGFLILNSPIYSQNAVQLLKSISKPGTKTLYRVVNLPAADYLIGQQALLSHSPTRFSAVNLNSALQLATEQSVTAGSLGSPLTIYGPYRYLRKVSDASEDLNLVNPAFTTAWKNINKVGYYNGAHHIVNKSVIKRIHSGLKNEGGHPNLEDMQRDAPAIFHPMHGNPNYTDVFHNHEEQYQTYRQYGIKAVMQLQIKKINQVNREIGLDDISDEMYNGLMQEAELWCKIYGMKFE